MFEKTAISKTMKITATTAATIMVRRCFSMFAQSFLFLWEWLIFKPPWTAQILPFLCLFHYKMARIFLPARDFGFSSFQSASLPAAKLKLIDDFLKTPAKTGSLDAYGQERKEIERGAF